MTATEGFFHPTLAARKDQTDPLLDSMRQHLGRLCENCLDSDAPGYIDYRERQSEWWTRRAGGRTLPLAIEHLAAGGILIDDRYSQAAVDIFRTVVDHRIVENTGGTNYGRPYHTWRDNPLDTGVSAAGLAIGLDLLRPRLSADEVARFGTYLIPFVDYILENPPDPEEAKPDWNIAAIGLVGAALLALVLRADGTLDDDRYQRALKIGKRRALLFLEKGHDGQGAFFEGPAYGSATVHYLSPLAFALARSGDRELVEHPGLGLLAEGLLHEIIPATGRLNPLNDCGDSVNVSWLSVVAAEQKNGVAQWTWQKVQGLPDDGPPPDDLDWSDTVTRCLLFCDPSLPATSPADAGIPPVAHFANRGLVDIRSGWERDDFFLSFLCDVFPAGGHRQADRNQFALHALGESFAIDSGYALERLDDTTEVLRLGALGEAHNLPLINGDMQRRGRVSDDGLTRVERDRPIPYIESEAGESYGSTTRFTRRLVCLPDADGKPACAVIADWLTFDIGESRPMLSWLLHTHADNDLQLERDCFTITGGRRGNHCLVQIVTPWPGRWRRETFFDHPRLRYDWFYNPLLCLVALVPYGSQEPPPQIDTQGNAEGCALTLTLGDTRYTLLSAAPDQTVRYDGVETDAEFALVARHGNVGRHEGVGRRRDQDEEYLLAAGSRLTITDNSLVAEEIPADFIARR